MSKEFYDSTYDQIRDVISRLQSPIQDLPTLYSLLAAPLHYLKILPPKFHRYNASPLPEHGMTLSKHIPLLQRALIEHVLPTWAAVLDEEDSYAIVQQYFAPDLFSFGVPSSREISVYAYATILSLPLTEHSVRLLVHLAKAYSVDVLWDTVISGRRKSGSDRRMLSWEDCVRNLAAIPSKVANAYGGHLQGTLPRELEFGTYFNNVSIRTELLFSSLRAKLPQDELSSLSYLITKFVNVGIFPSTVPSSATQPSFFLAVLPNIRTRLQSSPSYSVTWNALLAAIPSPMTLHTVIDSLFAHLAEVPDMGISGPTRALVKREALLLGALLGHATKDSEVTDDVLASVFGRQWSIGRARIYVCWAAGGETPTKGLQLLLDRAIDLWTTPDHIKHSLLADHQYLTGLVLLVISYLKTPTTTEAAMGILALARTPSFIKSISTYISHMDASVRRCGMLVAEEVAHACGKNLDFGDWDGEGNGRVWCRQIRQLMNEKDFDAKVEDAELSHEPPTGLETAAETVEGEARTQLNNPDAVQSAPSGYDSDDSLTGYISSPSSSRSPSPSPSELAEIEKDPSLNIGKPKVVRPVYLSQLGEMIRPTSGVRSEVEHEDVEKQELALNVAEELIRRKRAYGTELEENAVNLTYGLIGLQDNFDIDGFAEKRLVALVALVACCPRKAAPTLIEQFFLNQYSTDQRNVILNALALGARELASLPIPPLTADPKRISFPSKRLPPALHRKYITEGDQMRTINPVQHMLEGITKKAIEKSKETAEDKVPEIVRERQLRIKRAAKITEVENSPANALARQMQPMSLQPQPIVAFTDVAAEFFICPMINRFWLFLRDEQAREVRTAHQPGPHRYRGVGTGLVLNPLILSQFVATLAVLVHAAHNAKEWLAVIAPDALELAVTLGTRPLSQSEGLDDEEDEGDEQPFAKQGKEAALLANYLELAVVVIDGCLELDDGKSLGLEHTSLLLGAGEWGSEILSQLEKGVKVLGGGGKQEALLRRAAAGLVLKVDELVSRWRRSMVTMGYDNV